MNGDVVAQLISIIAPLSLVAVGGTLPIVPEIHRQVVETHGFLSTGEFAELIALAQVTPGPNCLVIALIGWKAAGWPGALAALLAMVVPSSILTLALAQAWPRLHHRPWLIAVRQGLAPIAIGLVLSSGFVLVTAADRGPLGYLVLGATLLVILRTSVHPLLPMLAAATLAAVGLL